MGNKKYSWVVILALIFIAGMGGGYFYFAKKFLSLPSKAEEANKGGMVSTDDLFTLRVYYPAAGGRLQMEERKIKRRLTQAEISTAVIEEYLKGPATARVSEMPGNVKLLGLYKGDDGILYVDLSDEFRRNFSGDALSEFLLLKGLFESLISNVQDITDVKVLIEGRETESLGGHVNLLYPLKDEVSSDSPDSHGRAGITGGADKRGGQ